MNYSELTDEELEKERQVLLGKIKAIFSGPNLVSIQKKKELQAELDAFSIIYESRGLSHLANKKDFNSMHPKMKIPSKRKRKKNESKG